MTRDEKILDVVNRLAAEPYLKEIANLKRKLASKDAAYRRGLAKMEAMKNNWRETALRREAMIKELKEKLNDCKRVPLEG